MGRMVGMLLAVALPLLWLHTVSSLCHHPNDSHEHQWMCNTAGNAADLKADSSHQVLSAVECCNFTKRKQNNASHICESHVVAFTGLWKTGRNRGSFCSGDYKGVNLAMCMGQQKLVFSEVKKATCHLSPPLLIIHNRFNSSIKVPGCEFYSKWMMAAVRITWS